MVNKIKVGIVGGAGYTGGELISLLLNHPNASIEYVLSSSNNGKYIYEVHKDLLGETSLKFTNQFSNDIDVLFICSGHGKSKTFLEQNKVDELVKVIDLSNDFRLTRNSKLATRNFTYGLPELQKESIVKSDSIANPGCFATCIQLGLLPLAKANQLNSEIHISAITGSTGAGQSPSDTSHFSWRNNNISTYKPFEHQHLTEIKQSLKQLQSGFDQEVSFLPYRGNFTRGILASIYLNTNLSLEDAKALYNKYYKHAPFVHLSENPIDLKPVVNTNKCILHLAKHGNKLLITSTIDNLAKGASGQAIQNMNIMFDLEETTGLTLKSNRF